MSTPPEPIRVTPGLLRDWRLPEPSGSKHGRGHVAVIGGSRSTPGAAMLAGLAALRVGAGVLAFSVADSVATAVATAVPEASVTGLAVLDDPDAGADLTSSVDGRDAVLVGPGIDAPEPATAVLEATLAALGPDAYLVVDAFGLGVLPGLDLDPDIARRSVLTPNRDEASHLLEAELPDDDAVTARRIVERFGATVSFAGQVAAPDGRSWVIDSGHPGLGTSGSGDVLAGCVVGLLARGADPAQAACWGTYLHGEAGDRLAARIGRLGFLARELVDELPATLVQAQV